MKSDLIILWWPFTATGQELDAQFDMIKSWLICHANSAFCYLHCNFFSLIIRFIHWEPFTITPEHNEIFLTMKITRTEFWWEIRQPIIPIAAAANSEVVYVSNHFL